MWFKIDTRLQNAMLEKNEQFKLSAILSLQFQPAFV